MSDLAPQTVSQFDPSRHTSWNDVVASDDGVIVKLKWSKTLQAVKGAMPAPLPALKESVVCPRAAWAQYVAALPDILPSASTPLLLSMVTPKGVPITAPKLRAMFNRVVVAAGLQGKGLTPHSLRRGVGRRQQVS